MIIVANSTPLIHLSAGSDLDILRGLFGALTIPEAVFAEVVTSGAGRPGSREVAAGVGAWITVEPWASTPGTRLVMEQQRLHTAEVHAIELAKTLRAELLVLYWTSGVQLTSLGPWV